MTIRISRDGSLRGVDVGGLLAAAVHEDLRAVTYARERRREEQAHVGDVGRVGHAAERHRRADRRDPLLVAVEQVRLLGDDETRRRPR